MPGLVAQQREHGLVAAVDAVEISDGQRAGWRNPRMVKASEYLHRGEGGSLRYLFDSSSCPPVKEPQGISLQGSVTKTGYIVLYSAAKRWT